MKASAPTEIDLNGRPGPVLNDNNGERMVPESTDAVTFWEHVYRYAFACQFVEGKRVLDVACGEGYGAAALQKAGAAQVVGVDLSDAACRHARQKYGLDARVGNAERMPVPDKSVDVIVSFETIEHLDNPNRFLDECLRVLSPGGRIIVSTPNKGVYSWPGGAKNPHHRHELTDEEFEAALRFRFRHVEFYAQRPKFAPWWSARSFVSENSFWRRIRGFGRARRWIQKAFSPESINELTAAQKAATPDLILNLRRRPHQFLNPYFLTRHRKWTGTRPTYIVANCSL